MRRCRTCLYPDTKPDLVFDETGECSACVSYKKRPQVDWDHCETRLKALLDRHDGRCIVPSSGGKDSHYQVIKLLEYGADVTVVTATTCHLTQTGRHNIDNLARYARTIEVTPNRRVRALLNRLAFEWVGDISWPEHATIFTVPFRLAKQLGINLIFYGENPQNQYGGPDGTDEALQMTRRWVSEFGGFLGLRPADFVGQYGITARDMADYAIPADIDGIEAHFLGQYIPWDSHRNAKIAAEHGMEYFLPSLANWWDHENLDNAQTGLHDYLMFLKYGYGRATAQLSVDIRAGLIEREAAYQVMLGRDGQFPHTYAGVSIDDVLGRIGLNWDELNRILGLYNNGIGQANHPHSPVQ